MTVLLLSLLTFIVLVLLIDRRDLEHRLRKEREALIAGYENAATAMRVEFSEQALAREVRHQNERNTLLNVLSENEDRSSRDRVVMLDRIIALSGSGPARSLDLIERGQAINAADPDEDRRRRHIEPYMTPEGDQVVPVGMG